MKHSPFIMLLSGLILVCGLLVALVAPGAAAAKSEGSKPQGATVYAKAGPQDPAMEARVEALRTARRAGDTDLVNSLCAELGWVTPAGPAPAVKATAGGPQVVIRPELAGRSETPGSDVLVNDPDWRSTTPAMASTADGTLYIVVDDAGPGQSYLDLYSSVNDGYTWLYEYSIYDTNDDLTNPSIAIGEGVVDRLLIAYESKASVASSAVFVFWQDLDTGLSGQVALVDHPNWAYNPQICVDSSAYDNWWPYLTFTQGVLTKQDRYDLMFARSTDYGETWATPGTLVTGVEAQCKPDIDYGEPCLFITYTRNATATTRDLHLLRSSNLGTSWDPELLLANVVGTDPNPRVAATKAGGTVVVAYTAEYSELDTDIDVRFSLDHGDSWDLAFIPFTNFLEADVDLEVSREQGRIHAAFWSEHDIQYTWAGWETPNVWSPVETMNDEGTAAVGIRPTVAVNPTKSQEACVAWTDTRVELQYNVFFDATYPVGDYLIIVAHAGLFEAVEPLVWWKEQLGYNVQGIDLDTIYANYTFGDDAERIWSYLHDNVHELKYVLLVGDIDMLPMRMLYPDGNPDYPPTDPRHHNGFAYGTDYYYAEHSVIDWDLDGDNRWGEFTDDGFDASPDLLVGRLPFNDVPPVQAICSNIVAFEQDTGPWKQNALLAHGFLSQASSATVPGSDCASMADYLRTNLAQPNSWTTTTLFEQGGLGLSAFGSTAGLSQATYESSCGLQTNSLISNAAHGNGTAFYAVRWLQELNGTGYCDMPEEWVYNVFSHRDMIPTHPAQSVLYLNGCSSAPIIGDDPDFMASPLRSRYLVRMPRHDLAFKEYLLHGAVGIIGASAGSEGSDNWLSPADGNALSLAYYFYENLIDDGMPVGDAFHLANHEYVLNHGLQRSMRVFNYYGDPSLVLPGIATGKRGATLAAVAPPPGLLAPDAALAQATSWQQRAGAAAAKADQALVANAKARDEATIWTECAELPECMVVTSLISTPGGGVFGAGIAARDEVGTRGVIVRSANGWDPWETTEIEGLHSARTIFRIAGGTLLVGGLSGTLPSDPHGVIHRSIDGGESWIECLDITGGLVTDICQALDGTLWATGGLNGSVFYSTNDGASWVPKVYFSGGPDLNSIMQASNGRFFITGDHMGSMSIIYSDDGVSWYPVPGLGLVESAYEIVEVDGRLYAGLAETDSGWVYRSDDLNGEYWNRVAELPMADAAKAVRSLSVDADGRILAGVSVSQAANATLVYAMDPDEGVWREFGGHIDLADRVTAILPVSGTVFIGTGSVYGNVYRCAGPVASGVDDEGQLPHHEFAMLQNYPNPFNPSTTIRYTMPEDGHACLAIYDVSGRLVCTLVDENVTVGDHSVAWTGRDQAGRAVPSGTYFSRLQAGGKILSGRMMLLR